MILPLLRRSRYRARKASPQAGNRTSAPSKSVSYPSKGVRYLYVGKRQRRVQEPAKRVEEGGPTSFCPSLVRWHSPHRDDLLSIPARTS